MKNFTQLEKNKKPELLAPAGSPMALRAAVLCGADAVYLGAKNFGARSSAANFSDEELAQAADFCHLRGAKLYLTVNTVYLEGEFEQLCTLIRHAAGCGVDGCIVQDLGACELLRRIAPDMPVHASTQMTVHTLEGVRLLAQQGIKRVVLSRELSKEEIEYICKNTDTEIEVFVHGALCISYSGKCLFSSAVGGRSGNRGKCAQPCRLKYNMDGNGGYLLSPKDLCLADEVSALEEIGVRSLKIEGRMKSPEYVAIVTSVYRRIIDSGEVTQADRDTLKDIFCRGKEFTQAYFTGVGQEKLINSLHSNDGTAKAASQALLKSAAKMYAQGVQYRRLYVDITLESSEQDIVLTMSMGDISCTQRTKSEDTPPLENDRVCAQLSKLGATPFYAGNIKADGEFKIRISTLNALRRDAAEQLSDLICKSFYKTTNDEYRYIPEIYGKNTEIELCAVVCTAAQAKAVMGECDIICVPTDLCDMLLQFTDKCTVYASVPTIIEKEYEPIISSQIKKCMENGVENFLCDSLDATAVVHSCGGNVIGGYGLNITNAPAADWLGRFGAKSVTASAELSTADIRTLSQHTRLPVNAVIYGRLALMQTKHCFMKGRHCGKCEAQLSDRTGAVFPVRRRMPGHGNVIYNSRPIYLADKQYENIGAQLGMMYFTVEAPSRCAEVIRMYKNHEKPDFEFTRGGQSKGEW